MGATIHGLAAPGAGAGAGAAVARGAPLLVHPDVRRLPLQDGGQETLVRLLGAR